MFILHGWLRSGNTTAGRGVIEFLPEAFALLPVGWRLRGVRADSGFFDGKLLTFLEEQKLGYIVVARLTGTLKRVAAGFLSIRWQSTGCRKRAADWSERGRGRGTAQVRRQRPRQIVAVSGMRRRLGLRRDPTGWRLQALALTRGRSLTSSLSHPARRALCGKRRLLGWRQIGDPLPVGLNVARVVLILSVDDCALGPANFAHLTSSVSTCFLQSGCILPVTCIRRTSAMGVGFRPCAAVRRIPKIFSTPP
jgi:hypothetical protein